MFLVFAEIPLAPASPNERNDGRPTVVLEMSATFGRQRGNGVVEVSAQMSALFHTFTCAFCLL